MKPTDQQKLWLQDYLRSILTYRETYEEVYDHVLAALDHKPASPFFESDVLEVIENDFGGMNGLVVIDEACKSEIIKTLNSEYKSYFTKKWLHIPVIIYFIVVAGLARLILNTLTHGITRLLFTFSSVVFWLIPICLVMIVNFNKRVKAGKFKPSPRDEAFTTIVYRPLKFVLSFFAYEGIFFYIILHILRIFKFQNPFMRNMLYFFGAQSLLIWSTIFTCSFIHFIAFQSMYRNEFKRVFFAK